MRRVILRAGFRLSPGNPRRMEELMREHRRGPGAEGALPLPLRRAASSRTTAPSARPRDKIVDSLGLKGRRIGGAQVAPFHGNIIVNTGGAPAQEVRALIQLVEEEVRRGRGFSLEREVILVGQW